MGAWHVFDSHRLSKLLPFLEVSADALTQGWLSWEQAGRTRRAAPAPISSLAPDPGCIESCGRALNS